MPPSRRRSNMWDTGAREQSKEAASNRKKMKLKKQRSRGKRLG